MNTFIAMTFLGLLSLSFQSPANENLAIESSDKTQINMVEQVKMASLDIEQSIQEITKNSKQEETRKQGCSIGHQINPDISSRTIIGSNAMITTARDIETGNEIVKYIVQEQQANPIANALTVKNKGSENKELFDKHQQSLSQSRELNASLSKEQLDKTSLERFEEYKSKKAEITQKTIDINQVGV